MASTPTPTPSSKTITLITSDGLDKFVLSEKAAFLSNTLKNMCDSFDDRLFDQDSINKYNIKLKSKSVNFTAKTLGFVVEYCNKHADADHTHSSDQQQQQQQTLDQWDEIFIKQLDRNQLFDIMLAADYLDIRSLLSLTSQGAADSLKNLSVEEVREIFGIVNDFTPEEEEALRLENQWAFR